MSDLINKIFWTKNMEEVLDIDKDHKPFYYCRALEEEGFGLLASNDDLSAIDSSYSVVCPDDTIVTPKQIIDYWERRRGSYSSRNPNDIKMHKVRMYYLTFKSQI